jgi:hypothetical protein
MQLRRRRLHTRWQAGLRSIGAANHRGLCVIKLLMYGYPRLLTSCLGAALVLSGCEEGDGAASAGDGIIGDAGDASGETLGGSSGDGDGDPTGDGDGDPADTGEPECDGTSPYMGGWDIGCCQDEVEPQNGWAPGGVHVGTIMPDWTLTDQFGEALRMYDFCHDAIWFEYVALW